MLGNAPSITLEEKQSALDRVLSSVTFARSDQLKAFLKFVCEMEIAGRGDQLSEYLVGAKALGRGESFSPSDDASVRNRAYALRQKLEKLYAEELTDASIRIDLQKGTYVPRWIEVPHVVASPVREAAFPQQPLPLRIHAAPPQSWIRFLAIFLLGAIVGGLVIKYAAKPAREPLTGGVDPIVREAWGPILSPNANVMICLGTAAQLTLLPFDIKFEWQPSLGVLQAPESLYPWYLRYHRFYGDKRLYLGPDMNSPHFGDVLGAIAAIHTLTAAGAGYQILPERLVPSADSQTGNTILFGVPYKSEAVLKRLEGSAFQFVYSPQLRDVVIQQTANGQLVKTYAPRRNSREDRVESYSLITVIPTPGSEGNARTIIFSGDPSAGAAAAVKFFTSPPDLQALKQRFSIGARSRFPSAYQVLIHCKLDQNLPESFSYEGSAVLHG